MAIYSTAVHIRFLERGECVDAPMVVRFIDGKLVIRDYRKLFSHPIYKVIDPIEVSLYRERRERVITLSNGDVIPLKHDPRMDVWNLFVRDREGELTMMRVRSQHDGVAMERKIQTLIRLNRESEG